LYPDVFNLGFARCPDWSPYAYILIGNVFFNNQDFEKAANLYNQAAKGLDPNQEAHLTATLNSGACYISLGQHKEAISAFQSVIDHAYERADVYRPMATINLSAAQIDAGFLNDAVHTIRELPTETLPEYWRGIHFSNALIAHQKLADYAGSDSVWQNHLSLIPFESLPLHIHPHVLSELLHRGDYIAFTQFRNQVLRSPLSPLLDPSHSHHQLFEAAENPTHSNILWELYRKVEDDLRKAHTFYIQETQPQLQSELQLIQKELGRERLSTRNWKLTTAFIVAALLSLFLVILILRTRRLRKHLLLVSQLEKSVVHQAPHVDEEDLVVLAQALTYGKGLQKALLIVRRLRAEFADHDISRLNLETIEFYEQLNEREREVAGYIASGFNSKEIAQLLNVTIQYIYNVRSRIRDKIGVPNDVDLLDWFREAAQVKVEDKGANSASGEE
jgi:DNA-binding CsgD family transcriptional regulator